MITKNRQSEVLKAVALTICAVVLLQFTGFAQGNTVTAISGFYGWLKPIVNWVLAIVLLFFIGRILFKVAFKSEQAGMEIAMAIIFLVVWGLWAIFANDILTLMSGGKAPAVTF